MKAVVYDKSRAPNAPQLNELGKPAPHKTKAPSRTMSAGWLVPAALLVLSVIPLIGGAFRLTELAGGIEIIPADARFTASPLPVALHIVSASVYTILGAFQFAAAFRQRRPGWHRRRRAGPGSNRTAGWAFGLMDDPVLSPRGWHR